MRVSDEEHYGNLARNSNWGVPLAVSTKNLRTTDILCSVLTFTHIHFIRAIQQITDKSQKQPMSHDLRHGFIVVHILCISSMGPIVVNTFFVDMSIFQKSKRVHFLAMVTVFESFLFRLC